MRSIDALAVVVLSIAGAVVAPRNSAADDVDTTPDEGGGAATCDIGEEEGLAGDADESADEGGVCDLDEPGDADPDDAAGDDATESDQGLVEAPEGTAEDAIAPGHGAGRYDGCRQACAHRLDRCRRVGWSRWGGHGRAQCRRDFDRCMSHCRHRRHVY